MTQTTNEFICDMSPFDYGKATSDAELMTCDEIHIGLPRRISRKELADLSDDWQNPTVDTRIFIQCVNYAYEVSKVVCDAHGKKGGLWQKHNNRFYIA
jgi:hypothetical protein